MICNICGTEENVECYVSDSFFALPLCKRCSTNIANGIFETIMKRCKNESFDTKKEVSLVDGLGVTTEESMCSLGGKCESCKGHEVCINYRPVGGLE